MKSDNWGKMSMREERKRVDVPRWRMRASGKITQILTMMMR